MSLIDLKKVSSDSLINELHERELKENQIFDIAAMIEFQIEKKEKGENIIDQLKNELWEENRNRFKLDELQKLFTK